MECGKGNPKADMLSKLKRRQLFHAFHNCSFLIVVKSE
jgi:hypothetical protein